MFATQRTQMLRPASIETCAFFPKPGKTIGDVWDWWELNGPIAEYFDVRPFRSLFEAYTPNSTGSRHEWKNFEHYKCSSSITNDMKVLQPTTWYFSTDAAGPGWAYHLGERSDPICGFSGFGGADAPFDGLIPLYAPDSSSGTFVPDPANLDDLKQRALRYTMPIVKSELSLVNSLIELKDFKSLPRTLAKSRTVLRQMVGTVIKRGKRSFTLSGRSTVRELTRAVADNYLQFAFNIKPLLSDIRGIYTAVTSLEKRVNRLIAGSAKTQVKHYIVPLNELNDSDETGSDYLFTHPYWSKLTTSKSRRQVFSESSKFHFQVEYNYNYTRYQAEHARLLAFLDMLGVNKLPNIIWNALPWSFVVDWVAGVGQYIDQFSPTLLEPRINIHRCLWSISRKRKVVCTFDMNTCYPSYPGYTIGTPASVTYETAYRRQVWVPTASSIRLSGVSSNEFTLGAALVVSRRRKPKRKR